MVGLAILLLFNMIGAALQVFLHIPLPGNVMGLILFTVSLFTGLIKLEWVETSAQLLLKHMMLFFAPIVVGTMVVFPLIRGEIVPIAVSLVGSSLVTLLVTGWVAKGLSRKEVRANEQR
jgi:holin-like protein